MIRLTSDRRFFGQIGRNLTAMLLRCGQATASWIVRQSKGAAAQNFHLTSRNTIESGSGMNESFVSGNHSSMLAGQWGGNLGGGGGGNDALLDGSHCQ